MYRPVTVSHQDLDPEVMFLDGCDQNKDETLLSLFKSDFSFFLLTGPLHPFYPENYVVTQLIHLHQN